MVTMEKLMLNRESPRPGEGGPSISRTGTVGERDTSGEQKMLQLERMRTTRQHRKQSVDLY